MLPLYNMTILYCLFLKGTSMFCVCEKYTCMRKKESPGFCPSLESLRWIPVSKCPIWAFKRSFRQKKLVYKKFFFRNARFGIRSCILQKTSPPRFSLFHSKISSRKKMHKNDKSLHKSWKIRGHAPVLRGPGIKKSPAGQMPAGPNCKWKDLVQVALLQAEHNILAEQGVGPGEPGPGELGGVVHMRCV